jgi:hypothetical protein
MLKYELTPTTITYIYLKRGNKYSKCFKICGISCLIKNTMYSLFLLPHCVRWGKSLFPLDSVFYSYRVDRHFCAPFCLSTFLKMMHFLLLFLTQGTLWVKVDIRLSHIVCCLHPSGSQESLYDQLLSRSLIVRNFEYYYFKCLPRTFTTNPSSKIYLTSMDIGNNILNRFTISGNNSNNLQVI